MTAVLLVDRSGRGHALAELFSRTNPDVVVYYAPGCAAIPTERVISLSELSLSDSAALLCAAREKRVDLVFVANAVALADGLVDAFRKEGFSVIGPNRAASKLESSKVYGKQFCSRHNIPVAEYRHFDNPREAIDYVERIGYQVVVKADGLCGGNGSFVCDDEADAVAAINTLMVERKFDDAGSRVVIEKRLFGRELSFFALLDGEGYLLLPMALDYKKSDDGNKGITCGGMGACSPHPLETEEIQQRIKLQLLDPLIKALKQEEIEYTGVIYLGCMLVDEQFHLLEINVRLGEPEAEVVLSRIQSDFLSICDSVTTRTVSQQSLALDDFHYCDVVLAQGRTKQISNGKNKGWYAGWPYGRYGKYYPISGVDNFENPQCKLFLGEAYLHPQKGLVSDGGRVIHVVGKSKQPAEAVDNAYENVKRIHFTGMRYRNDIGKVLPWDIL